MARRFDCFVILGAMRTGSNLLEESLGACEGLTTYGEVFNPVFIGHQGQATLLGTTIAQRDRDPLGLLSRIVRESAGVPGFRLFPGHDPRVFRRCLEDPRCGKIVLARNPVDSFVSLEIARKTGQWWLGDVRKARKAAARFDVRAFDGFVDELRAFYGEIRRVLQATGQTAFHIHYDDLGDEAVLDGLARWLGASGPAAGRVRSRVQNPEPLERKVENFAEMEAALGRADAFDLFRIPDLEPRRGPNVPSWMASDALGLLFMPLAGGPTARVADWLALAGGAPPTSGWTRKSLHAWLRATPGHRSFTVVTHPLRRAHDVFRDKIVATGPDTFVDIRAVLTDRYRLDLPDDLRTADASRHRAAFLGFLGFLKANLGGQTSVRVPAAWASQAVLVRALTEVAPPDMILRAETLGEDLAGLRPGLPRPAADDAEALAAIYDAEVEAAARAACARDYMTFGYGDWR